MSDYHLHLHPHAPTAEGPPAGTYPPGHIESFVERAANRGVHELGITEHFYRFVESEPALGRFWEAEPNPELAAQAEEMVRLDRTMSIDRYVDAVCDAKASGLPVRLGLEVDFFPETIEAVLDVLEPYPWDLLIGSVHWIGGWTIDTSATTAEFHRRGIDMAWRQYFDLETQLAGSGAVDVLAHVDVIKKYGFRPATEPVELYDQVVGAAVDSGTAVEVSSQGLRKPAGEVYPAPEFLRRFRQAGVPITLASDGHVPDEAAWGHDEVVAAARTAGYTTQLSFDRRARTEVPL